MYKPSLLLFFHLLFFNICNAQTPQWQWAKGIGGNYNEGVLFNNNALQVDSLGNSYEVLMSQSSSIKIGTTTYPNPQGGSNSVFYFIKYSPTGTVTWCRQFAANIAPTGMFTTPQGYSFLMFDFRDSIKLGSVTYKDSSVHTYHTGANYCIAKYDPDGNVLYVKAHQCVTSGMSSIRQFYGDKILATGSVQHIEGDTLNGHPVPRGYFLSVLDSFGNVLSIKAIGYDSLGTEFFTPACVVVSNQSVYFNLSVFYNPIIYQDNLPVGDLTPYIHGAGNLLFKLDTALTFQWFKVTSKNIGSIYTPLAADSHDNVYVLAGTKSNTPEDTLVVGTTNVVIPYIAPRNTYYYRNILKLNGNGDLQWVNNIIGVGTTSISSLCTDKQDNVYVYGRYQSFIVAGADTLNDYGDLFVTKLSNTGAAIWSKGTMNAGYRSVPYGIGTDAQGNVLVNGYYSDPNAHIAFGSDVLICSTPIGSYPLAPDIFNAKLNTNSIVPLTLLNIDAAYQTNVITVKWTTSNEINTATYIIQRSTDRNNFEDIGTVAAKGRVTNAYAFTDNNLSDNSIFYYRLRMIDVDGSYSYSKIVAVAIPVTKQGFTIAPNPASSFTTLYFIHPIANAVINVYNAIGEKVFTQALINTVASYKMDIQSLQTGMYFIEVKSDKETYLQKLVIDK